MAGFKSSLVITLILCLAVLLGTALTVQIREVPSLSTIKKTFRSSNLTILDRGGRVIDEIVKAKNVRRLNWVTLDEVPRSFVDAILKSERWRLSKGSVTRRLSKGELWPSIALEMVWSQDEILEAYINLSVYRGELQGLAAASQALFDRPPRQLTRAQAAVLASLMNSKGQGVERVRGKACALLRSLDADEDCALVGKKHLANIERAYRVRPFVKLAPQVAQILSEQSDIRDENVVHSTLDREIQWRALHALQKADLRGGAVAVLENKSGHVLAYADLGQESLQAGSSLKPFLFANALEERTLTSAVASQALTGGLQLPSLRALELVGSDTFVKTLSLLGFSGLERPELYGPSLALGAAPVNLLELANAYRALANKGVWSPLRFSPQGFSEEAARRIFSSSVAYLISDILREDLPREIWTAVFCHEWCIGYSEKYTLAVAGGGKAVWQELMGFLHKSESSKPSPVPAGLKSSGGEWVLTGTDTAPLGQPSRITYPVDQTRIELDPKRAKENVQLFIQVAAPKPDQNLYLNGRRLGRARSLLPWRPESGDYVLELRDAKGQVLHKVKFEVRGLSFAAGDFSPEKL